VEIKTLTIPSGVKYIGDKAFETRTSLESVIIGADVILIGTRAFENCSGLKTVTFEGNSQLTIKNIAFSGCTAMEYYDFTACTAVPTLSGTGTFFHGIPSTCEIRVPAALYDGWIAATNWSTYADNIVAV
jgi:hypothetical protein